MTKGPFAFGDLPLERASAKPRESGITMVIDWGLPLGAQGDLLQLAGEYIDIAKIAVGIAGLLALGDVRDKVERYRSHTVDAFPGGMFLEYALAFDRAEAYFDGCAEVGFRTIEVSDNAVPISRRNKEALIGQAVRRGFRVLGEVGSKHAKTPIQALIDDLNACVAAGSWKVFVEAAELMDGEAIREELIERIAASGALDRVIWELPGTWIEGIHEYQIQQLERRLIDQFGAQVNLANVPIDGVLVLETHRRGVGVGMLADRISSTNS
jgi:phosphosulfolactate synthase